jgi:hypothetical protein
MDVKGIVIHVMLQLLVDISPFSSGREGMVVTGTVGHVPLQLEVGIFLSSNGRERMNANGTVGRVVLQLIMGISSSSNGRERIDVTGTNIHLKQLRDVATKMCPIMSMIIIALDNKQVSTLFYGINIYVIGVILFYFHTFIHSCIVVLLPW